MEPSMPRNVPEGFVTHQLGGVAPVLFDAQLPPVVPIGSGSRLSSHTTLPGLHQLLLLLQLIGLHSRPISDPVFNAPAALMRPLWPAIPPPLMELNGRGPAPHWASATGMLAATIAAAAQAPNKTLIVNLMLMTSLALDLARFSRALDRVPAA
jgi:hypothetical protein